MGGSAKEPLKKSRIWKHGDGRGRNRRKVLIAALKIYRRASEREREFALILAMPSEKAALVSYFGDRAAVQEMEINRGNEKRVKRARRSGRSGSLPRRNAIEITHFSSRSFTWPVS